MMFINRNNINNFNNSNKRFKMVLELITTGFFSKFIPKLIAINAHRLLQIDSIYLTKFDYYIFHSLIHSFIQFHNVLMHCATHYLYKTRSKNAKKNSIIAQIRTNTEMISCVMLSGRAYMNKKKII